MGVLIVMTVPGDTAQFESFVAGNKQLVEELTDKAKTPGTGMLPDPENNDANQAPTG